MQCVPMEGYNHCNAKAARGFAVSVAEKAAPQQAAYARAASWKGNASTLAAKAWTRAEEEERKGEKMAKAKLAAMKATASVEEKGDARTWLEAMEKEIAAADDDVAEGVQAFKAMKSAKEAELARQKAAGTAAKLWKPVAHVGKDAMRYMDAPSAAPTKQEEDVDDFSEQEMADLAKRPPGKRQIHI